MVDTTGLVAARDQLNKDIDALVAAAANPASTIKQTDVDTLTAEASVLDKDVVTTTGTPALDFTQFNAAMAKLNTDAAAFVADANVKQSDIDSLTTQIGVLDTAVVTATV